MSTNIRHYDFKLRKSIMGTKSCPVTTSLESLRGGNEITKDERLKHQREPRGRGVESYTSL